jgi:hypothetical protein
LTGWDLPESPGLPEGDNLEHLQPLQDKTASTEPLPGTVPATVLIMRGLSMSWL